MRAERKSKVWRIVAPVSAAVLGLAALAVALVQAPGQRAEAASTTQADVQVLVPSDEGWTPVSLSLLVLVEAGMDPEVVRAAAIDGMVERFPEGTVISASSEEPGTVQGAYILAGWKWAEGLATWSYNPEGAPGDGTGYLEALLSASETWAEAGARFEFGQGSPTGLVPSLCEDGTRDGINTVGWAESLPGTTLAVTCTFPKSGPDASESDIAFDATREWTLGTTDVDIDFESVALHELGHMVGLGHSAVTASVMTGTYKAGTVRRELHTDDLAGLFNLYGEADTPTPSPTWTPTAVPTLTPTATVSPGPTDPPLPLAGQPMFAPGLSSN